MTRTRLAVLLAALAAVAVLGTVALAVVRGSDEEPAAAPRTLGVADPGSGATFVVPATGWGLRDDASGIGYGSGSDAVVVRGPALLREGYCEERPAGSFRAVAGFTEQSFDDWVAAVGGSSGAWSSGTRRSRITLAGGESATLSHVGLLVGSEGPCSGGAVDLAMVRAGDVRVVVVADTDGSPGTLGHADLDEIAATLRLN